MKKTITTALLCLSLATAASAVTLEDAVLSATGTISASYTGDFSTMTDDLAHMTIMIVLDLNTLPAFTVNNPSADTSLFQLSGTKLADNSTMAGVGMGLSRFGNNDPDTIAWTTWQGNKNGTWAGRFQDYASADNKTVLTMVLDADGAHVSTSNGIAQQTANNTTAVRYSTLDYDTITFGTTENIFGAIEGVYIFNQALGTNDIKTISAQLLVPEPTTATLSLLALAGLAARRRRK